MKVEILRLIKLKRPDWDLLMEGFDCRELRNVINSALREKYMVDGK